MCVRPILTMSFHASTFALIASRNAVTAGMMSELMVLGAPPQWPFDGARRVPVPATTLAPGHALRPATSQESSAASAASFPVSARSPARHFGFGAYSAHHPLGSILPSTTLHESGGAQSRHLSHS